MLINKLHVVGIVAIVIAFFQVTFHSYQCRQTTKEPFSFQLFGLIISMLLFCTIKHKK